MWNPCNPYNSGNKVVIVEIVLLSFLQILLSLQVDRFNTIFCGWSNLLNVY